MLHCPSLVLLSLPLTQIPTGTMKPLHSIVLFVATCLALLFGASNPCLLLSCFMILLVVVLALGVTIIYVEDLRKTLVVPLGMQRFVGK